MRTPIPRVSRRGRVAVVVLLGLLVVLTLASWLVTTWTNWLWFTEVGLSSVFGTVLRTRSLLFAMFGLGMAIWVWGNLYVAFRLRPGMRPSSAEQQSLDRYRLVVTPRIGLWIGLLAALCGLIAGLSAQQRWPQWLLFWNSQPFGRTDPQFKLDIAFYIFEYPLWRYLVGTGFTAVVLAVLGALFVHYLYGGVRLQGRGDRMSNAARVHLSSLVGLFVLLKAVAYWLDRYGLLLNNDGDSGMAGAGYADVNALLPAKEILTWVAIIAALAVLVFSNAVFRNLVWPGVALGLLGVSAVAIGGVYPWAVQTFEVKPNSRDKEAPYIERTILATRDAYGINTVRPKPYPAEVVTPPPTLATSGSAAPNMRLLDPSVVSDTYTQLQQVRGFYDFGQKLDIDRYELPGGGVQDYVVGVRELNSTQLTGNQTNWQNRHTVFTHGYGFVAAPANRVVCSGQPFFVSGFLTPDQPGQKPQQPGEACNSGNDLIHTDQPRIYYGEQVGDYAIVGKAPGGKDREFDRPTEGSGGDGQPGDASEEVSVTYNGKGGVPVDSFGRRLLYAWQFKEANFLLSDAFNENSKLIYVRDPRSRVEKAAPFLTVDGDPYPAVVNKRIVWILDAYTTAATFPYAEGVDLQEAASDALTGSGTAAQARRKINYIRNSVKATVDAYDGSVKLYEFDDKDPVLKAWNAAFDGIITPKKDIPPELAEHFRYPEDLFKVQRDMLVRYHVTNPQEFFGGQDFWEVPKDPTNPDGNAKQPPYYLLAQYPDQQGSTFQLTAAVTPKDRQNLAALISGYYDPQGKPTLQVLDLPGNTAVPGPVQVQQKMQSYPDVRRDLTLFESTQSQVVFGNLLTLPVGGGLLYVEPMYIKTRSDDAYPLMRKVLLSYGEYIAYADTLKEGLDQLVAQATGKAPPPSDNEGAQPPANQNPQTAAAVAKINKALQDLKKAQQAGDFEAYGKALRDLDAAIKEYEAAQRGQPAPGATPSPATPSPTVPPGTAPPGG